MDTLEMLWPIIRNFLGILFFLCCFILVPLLYVLAVAKKRLLNYIEQIDETGKITHHPNSYFLAFDLFIFAYILMPTPPRAKSPKYYSNNEVATHLSSINQMVNVVKPIAKALVIITISLLVLLNLFD